jgi:hypothetical protein
MSSALRSSSQIPVRFPFLRTIVNTAWVYPVSDIEDALATTAQIYTFDGTNIVAADVATLSQINEDIFVKTTSELPPNGYNCGVGTLLYDLGKTLTFQLSTGEIFLVWRLVKNLTNQASLPSGGDIPVGTVGYIPVFVAPGNIIGAQYDPVRVVRIG